MSLPEQRVFDPRPDFELARLASGGKVESGEASEEILENSGHHITLKEIAIAGVACAVLAIAAHKLRR